MVSQEQRSNAQSYRRRGFNVTCTLLESGTDVDSLQADRGVGA